MNHSPISISNAPHFNWGDACDGWWLKNTGKFTVIAETMPPASREKRHFHKSTEQFFYCLSGNLSIEIEGQNFTLSAQEGISISAGAVHQVKNISSENVHFLVISAPNSHEDRVNLE